MSNIPKNRKHLNELIEKNFDNLMSELKNLENNQFDLKCDENFTIRDIIAIRIWWSESVVKWIEKGKLGKHFDLPAKGYNWRETPALNQSIAEKSKKIRPFTLIKRLQKNKDNLTLTIESLSQKELEKVGVFLWAGKWPLMRWISMSSSTQFQSARKMIRKAVKAA